MIKANFSTYNNYVTDSLYQWDINQVLSVSGLNLSVAPEVHFSNADMDKAVVRQSTLNKGVVSVLIPNSLLQSPLTIIANIGVYEGDSFKVLETLSIPVKAKAKPTDYKLENSDEEVYSFEALKTAIANMVTLSKFNSNTASIVARIDNLIAHNNKTDGNSELIDVRTDIDGTVHASAGQSVRDNFRKLRVLHNSYYQVAPLLTGSIVSVSDTYRLHVFLNPAVTNIKVIASDVYQYGIQGYDSSDYTNKVYDSGWLQNDRTIFDLDESLFYNIEFKKVDESQKMTDADREYITVLQSVDLTKVITDILSQTATLENDISKQGGLYNTYYHSVKLLDGSISGSANYYRYHALFERPTTHIKVLISDEYTIGLQGYDSDNYSKRVYDSGWKKGACEFFDLDTSLYYNIEIRKTDESVSMSDEDRNNITILQAKKLTETVDNLVNESALKTQPYYNADSDFIKSIAHRGYSSEAPENTAPAFILAKQKGFTYVETDIQVTKDGKYVCIHDETCSKYTNGALTGAVSEYTLAELQAQDWGAWKDKKWTGTKILTFEEFVQLCKALSLNMYIEFKFNHTESDIEYYVNYVKSLGMLKKVSWLSNQYTDYVRAYDPTARVSMTGGVVPNDTALRNYKNTYMTTDDSFFLDLDVSCVTQEVSDKLTALNIPLEVWTVNDIATVQNLLAMNVKGITTDSLIVGEEMYKYYIK